MAGNFDRKLRLPRIHVRVPLPAANMRHGTKSFTSPPKEGVLSIFLPWKIRRLRRGLNPRTWVPKASTLPLDHRSRYRHTLRICNTYCFAATTVVAGTLLNVNVIRSLLVLLYFFLVLPGRFWDNTFMCTTVVAFHTSFSQSLYLRSLTYSVVKRTVTECVSTR